MFFLFVDQFREDSGGSLIVHGRLSCGPRVHCRSSAAISEDDDEQLALGFDGCLIHLVTRTLTIIQGGAFGLCCI